jgi:DNA-binding response OmpR family regulator
VLGLECGADDYMVKPCSSLVLSARVKTILKQVEKKIIKGHYEVEVKDISINLKSIKAFD